MPKLDDPVGLVWRVACEFCPWLMENLPERKLAVTLGHNHIQVFHGDAAEWSFRVQGYRSG